LHTTIAKQESDLLIYEFHRDVEARIKEKEMTHLKRDIACR
jgi:hypothetical protein